MNNNKPIRLEIPELSVVALVGASGCGKSTFAAQHFKPTEVLSSDAFRAMVSDDENNQAVTSDAFDALHYVAGKRLALGHLTVIDATNVTKIAREGVLKLADEQNCLAVAIVLNIPEAVCRERNAQRKDRSIGGHVIARQAEQLRQSIRNLKKEGFRYVYILDGEEEVASAQLVRVPLWNNKKGETGPFDIIGDVHGCYDELCALLTRLGYTVDEAACAAIPPEGRRAVFVGDLCDRGPKNAQVLRLLMNMASAGHALCVAGNHDVKLERHLGGGAVKLTHGLDVTAAELSLESEAFRKEARMFLNGLTSHYVFDGGRLVVAHAGIKEKYQGRGSGRVRNFCLYGDTTGETDEYGLPVRLAWADDYRGKALVVYGHTPMPEVQNINNAVCIDTGCVFGGKLTAYRYPEREIVQVAAPREYYAPSKPLFIKTEGAAGSESDGATPASGSGAGDMLNIDDVMGTKRLQTRLRRSIQIHAENAAAALEVMSRYAADPHWLIYLPPTMSPCETSKLPDYLEYPTEAFAYYRANGVAKVVCEQKHMGSRAVIVLCRDSEAAARRFGVSDGSAGIIYTRTGRHFFEAAKTENALLSRLRTALTASGFWADFATDWVCLDCELMPWSAKAKKLIENSYAPVGLSGRGGLSMAMEALSQAIVTLGNRDVQVEAQSASKANLPALLEAFLERKEALDRYTDSYRRYCWDVNSLDDYRIAPFHLLAAEGKVFGNESNEWHMQTLARYVTGTDPVFIATDHRIIDLSDETSVQAGIDWWLTLTGAGGEGMVVKPYDFIATRGGDLLQPAVKCRGREYLRIIYGAEYTLGDHLLRLKKRSLGKKQALALNEFALGIESLERFVMKEPLYRVHACVFGVLALESEPVDPRL